MLLEAVHLLDLAEVQVDERREQNQRGDARVPHDPKRVTRDAVTTWSVARAAFAFVHRTGEQATTPFGFDVETGADGFGERPGGHVQRHVEGNDRAPQRADTDRAHTIRFYLYKI